mmetsp:Transcript_31479/g.74644  ORF Transcript_31479/g.74644 Transcript_31479/m.74644 type:complete len:103 (-) Transcript_31479:403-711(-)
MKVCFTGTARASRSGLSLKLRLEAAASSIPPRGPSPPQAAADLLGGVRNLAAPTLVQSGLGCCPKMAVIVEVAGPTMKQSGLDCCPKMALVVEGSSRMASAQ